MDVRTRGKSNGKQTTRTHIRLSSLKKYNNTNKRGARKPPSQTEGTPQSPDVVFLRPPSTRGRGVMAAPSLHPPLQTPFIFMISISIISVCIIMIIITVVIVVVVKLVLVVI